MATSGDCNLAIDTSNDVIAEKISLAMVITSR
jgi:hypothetical protein